MADDQERRVGRVAGDASTPNPSQTSHTDLLTQVAELRAELAALRAELATEIRTRRLVVIDEAGEARITTRVDADSTTVKLSSAPLPDLGGAGDLDRHATVELWAARRDEVTKDEVIAEAQVTCSTGDDSYAVLAQRQIVDEDGFSVVEAGEVEVDQQQWRWGPDGEMHIAKHSTIRVDENGLTQRG